VIGPDIVRFHAAMWPAMLHAAGLEPPRGVWSHGWINTQGERFSKSAGVRVSLREIVDRRGPDPLRYFLLREVPWDGDGNFSFDRFDARYTSDLADGYGNLVSRVLAMLVRYLDAAVPGRGALTPLDQATTAAWTRYTDAMDRYLLHEGAAAAMALVAEANGFIETRAPWAMAKQGNRAALADTLGALADTVQVLTLMLSPFLPAKTAIVWHALGNRADVIPVTGELPSPAGQRVEKITPLFPKP
jgi:methionyl-tRNA synthetase